MIGFGIACGALLILGVIAAGAGRLRLPVSAALVVILFGQMTISYTYGNVLDDQTSFERNLAFGLVSHMFALAGTMPTLVTARGMEPLSPLTHDPVSIYPIIQTLLPKPLHGAWHFSGLLLKADGLPRNFSFLGRHDPQSMMKKIYQTCDFDRSIPTMYYNIYLKGRYMLVDFTKRCPNH